MSVVVDLAARRTAEASRAAAEAQALSSVAGATLGEQETLPVLLERVRSVFGAGQVAMVERVAGVEVSVAVVGTPAPDDVEQLRRKLEPDPAHPVHLITEAGMGYRFDP